MQNSAACRGSRFLQSWIRRQERTHGFLTDGRWKDHIAQRGQQCWRRTMMKAKIWGHGSRIQAAWLSSPVGSSKGETRSGCKQKSLYFLLPFLCLVTKFVLLGRRIQSSDYLATDRGSKGLKVNETGRALFKSQACLWAVVHSKPIPLEWTAYSAFCAIRSH